jgi:hypothetical protein
MSDQIYVLSNRKTTSRMKSPVEIVWDALKALLALGQTSNFKANENERPV